MKILRSEDSTVPNQILVQPTKPVTSFGEELAKLVRGMEKTLKAQHDPEGVGLAAPQIGVNLRLAIVRFDSLKEGIEPLFLALVNPEITAYSGKIVSDYEGCLSVPDQYGLIERDLAITVSAQDLKGERLELKAEGFLARIIQHEIDHLNGKLITEKVQGKFYTGEELETLLSKR